ncbi:hypothetical protein J6590_043859 [Homalodisca vitripennis]|nr:hypothetical protein J6590_043859 [Homalodisca vitripennis]
MEMVVLSLLSELNCISVNFADVNLSKILSALGALIKAYDEIADNRNSLKSINNELNCEIAFLKAKLDSEKESRINDLNDSFKTLDISQAEIEVLQGAVHSLNDKLKLSQLKSKNLEAENLSLSERIDDLDSQVSALKTKTDELTSCRDGFVNSLNNLRSKSNDWDKRRWLDDGACKTLSVKLGVCESKFVEMPCAQQRNDFECGINLIVNLKFILNFYVIPKVAMRFYEWYFQCFVSKPIIVTRSSKPSTDIEITTASSPEHTQTPFPSTHCSQATESNKSESLIPKLTLFRSECGRWEIQKPKKSKRSPKKSSKLQNLTELAGGVTLYNSYSALQCEETLCHNTNSMNSDESKSNSYFSKTIRNNSFCPKIKNGTMVPKDLTKVLPSRKSVNAVNPKKDSTTILQCMSTSELDKHVKSSHKVLILSDSHGRTVGHSLNAATNDEYVVTAMIKPGGKLEDVIDGSTHVVKTLTNNDYAVEWLELITSPTAVITC